MPCKETWKAHWEGQDHTVTQILQQRKNVAASVSKRDQSPGKVTPYEFQTTSGLMAPTSQQYSALYQSPTSSTRLPHTLTPTIHNNALKPDNEDVYSKYHPRSEQTTRAGYENQMLT